MKEKCEEFATCLCMIIGEASLFVGFLVFVGVMMAVMAISFSLLLHLSKALWTAENGWLLAFSFKSY